MKHTLLLLAVALLTSCAAKMSIVKPVRQGYNTEKLNTVLTKEIGEPLCVKGDQEVFDGLKITKVTDRQYWQDASYSYNVGDIFPLMAATKQYKLYFHPSSISESKSYYNGNIYTTLSFYGVAQSTENTERVQPFIRQTTGALGGVLTKPAKDFEAEPAKYINLNCENCFKKEIVFTGKTGNSIKFLYREYIENLARPAFTQELQYDLSESNVIGFKGMRIEVIKATNTNIEYKILSDFTN